VGKGCRFQGRFIDVDGHVEMGERCKLRDNVILRTHLGGKIVLADRVGLSFYCLFEATRMIKIGRFTGVAEFTVMRDTNHLVLGTAEHWRLTPHIAEPIVVGECCLIGSRSYIGPGVAIGDGAVLAPNSVVLKDVGPFEVWGGNPARKIGHRTHGLLAETMRKRYGALMAEIGVQESPFDDIVRGIYETAESGVNRAAEERDRLTRELCAEALIPGLALDD
jgi:acetyltransferase-like isoleucine patch superfamily enzyme